jgi:dephospho-CoA kinase
MKIIAFTGMPFSGKSKAVNIAKDMNIPVIRMGDLVWEEVKSQGLEINDKNVGMVANEMRKQKGNNIWAKRTVEKIRSITPSEYLVIDGIRNIEEIEVFKKEIGEEFIVIAVEVSDNLRYSRAMSRRREDDSMNIEMIIERDKREISWGLNAVIASADIVISNEGTIEEFYDKIKEVFKKI